MLAPRPSVLLELGDASEFGRGCIAPRRPGVPAVAGGRRAGRPRRVSRGAAMLLVLELSTVRRGPAPRHPHHGDGRPGRRLRSPRSIDGSARRGHHHVIDQVHRGVGGLDVRHDDLRLPTADGDRRPRTRPAASHRVKVPSPHRRWPGPRTTAAGQPPRKPRTRSRPVGSARAASSVAGSSAQRRSPSGRRRRTASAELSGRPGRPRSRRSPAWGRDCWTARWHRIVRHARERPRRDRSRPSRPGRRDRRSWPGRWRRVCRRRRRAQATRRSRLVRGGAAVAAVGAGRRCEQQADSERNDTLSFRAGRISLSFLGGLWDGGGEVTRR